MYKYTAVIIEPRQHKALSFVLNNFLENLSDEWGFIIFHSDKNKVFLEDIIENELGIYKKKIIKLVNLNVDNLTNKEYNTILKSREFYSHIETDLFLIFQTDTLIIKENKNIINEFLEYHYVGAPWANGKNGNGGLSLRNKSKILQIIETVDSNFKKNEDEFFSLQEEIDIFKPSFKNAKKFAVETVFYESPFGVHNCYNYLSNNEWSVLTNKYPDLLKLQTLNTIQKNEEISPFTVIFKNDDDSLNTLKNSLISFMKYVNLDNIYEIILFIHNRINDATHELVEKIQIKHKVPCKIISIHYDIHGYLKQKVVACNSFEICKTKYIAIFNNYCLFTKNLNFNKYLNMDQIDWLKLSKYDPNFKPFIFTKQSLQDASNHYKHINNNNSYQSICETKIRELNIEIFHPFPEEYKNSIFNDEEYLLNYIKTNPNNYILPKKKVIFVLTHKVCNYNTDEYNNFWGLGDIIRGLIAVFQLSKKYNFELIVDIQHHNISKYFKEQNHELSDLIVNNKDNICFIDNPEQYIINNNNDIMYFFTNDKYHEEITDESRDFVKNIFNPKDEFKIYIDNQIKNYNTPTVYNILHFRLGDDLIVRNQHQDFTYLKHKIEQNYEQNDILISDSKEFKEFVKREYPHIFQYDIDIGHIGLDSHVNAMKDTLFELMIITKSQKIKTYSVYNHTSGFVRLVHDIYKIPLICI